MPNRWVRAGTAIVAAVSIPALSVPSEGCDQCDAVLVRPVNELRLKSREDCDRFMRDFLQTMTYQEARRKTDGGGSLNILGQALPIGLSGNFSEEDFRRAQSSLRSETDRSTQLRSRREVVFNWVSPDAARAWEHAYVARHGSGLQAYFDDPDGGLPAFQVSWIPAPGDTQLPRVRGFSVEGATVAPGVRFEIGQELGTGNTNAIVIRRDPDRPVRVTLETSKGTVTRYLPILRCATCKGKWNVPCRRCDAQGTVADPSGPAWVVVPCSTCNEKSIVACPECAGRGKPAGF